MKFPLGFVFLVLNLGNILGKYVNFNDDLTYNDLLQTNVTCAYIETCTKEPTSLFQDRTCSCDSDCSEFGICCIDSPYRDNVPPMVKCQNTALSFSEIGYSLVSSCPPEVNSESVWKDLCEKDWDGEEDVMKLAPVSSLDTFVSYKNYYCFKCHEGNGKFVRWDLRIESNSVDKDRVSEEHFSVTYDRKGDRWIATTGDDYVLEDIHWGFKVPETVSVHPETCKFVLVSDCDSSWTDENTREKCKGYTAIVYSRYNITVSFQNPHCALCNYVPRETIECGFQVFGAAFIPSKRFSFDRLLNINQDDFDKAETEKCADNQLWDPYGRKCRRIACAIPGYVVKEGRCTPP